ncbi:hypothetical protein EYF80_002442 [Liparis tanakae]|uniref:Uncharacterized protein n=1 Tax=Liparis tanakae TaxID=230148 RepID=A0A4Z2JAV0_9TELE|nr:hypothetical protein EYF80_002442 [Liparis tanakae]
MKLHMKVFPLCLTTVELQLVVEIIQFLLDVCWTRTVLAHTETSTAFSSVPVSPSLSGAPMAPVAPPPSASLNTFGSMSSKIL